MKKFFILTLFLLLSLTAYAQEIAQQGIAESSTISDPHYIFSGVQVPESPIEGRNSFQTSLLTGAASYTHKIEVPKGTNGLTPQVFLSYNSQSIGKAGIAGLGWDLSLSYIERDVNYTPDNLTDDRFNLILNGQSYKLAYVPSENRYHTDIESYLFIEGKSGSIWNKKGDYWVIKTKDGTEYWFGYYGSDYPILSLSETICSNRDYVHRWYLDTINDTHGNKIRFKYRQNSSSDDIGAVYPYEIIYNNDEKRRVEFVFEDRPDKVTVYDQGCKIRESRRLQGVDIISDNSLVRKYLLNYSMNPAGSKSLLSSITECGNDGVSCLPPSLFIYQGTDGGFNSTPVKWGNSNGFGNSRKSKLTGSDPNLKGVTSSMLDMNGDGLIDYITKSNDYWDVYLNTGNGFSRITWSTPFNAFINIFDESDGYVVHNDTFDINGDSLPDYVVKSGDHWNIYLNTGNGFSSIPIYWNTSGERYIGTGSGGYTFSEVFDINGDGLSDYISTNSSGWYAFINNGNGFNDAINWTAPKSKYWQASDRGLIRYIDGSSDVKEDTFDVNGDRLPDIVQISSPYWSIYLNNGNGFDLIPVNWSSPGLIREIFYFEYDPGSFHPLHTGDTFDINGDGLPDKIHTHSNSSWSVKVNKGSNFSENPIYWETFDLYTGMEYIRGCSDCYTTIDINGDGLVDYVFKPSNSNWTVHLNKNRYPDLLTKIQNSFGGTTTITYKSSTQFDNALAFPIWVVSSVTEDNSITGIHHTSGTYTYNYSNGLYDYKDKEFRGFGYVRVLDPNGDYNEYYFHQDDARKGRTISAVSRDKNDLNYTVTENTWLNFTRGDYQEVMLTKVLDHALDGTSSKKIVETDYQYDSYGNIVQTSYQGDISITGDEKYLSLSYTYNTSNWLVAKIATTTLIDSYGSKLSETLYLYDGHINTGDPPDKGDLTKEIRWLSSGNAETSYEYYPQGNLKRVTDAEGRSTSYEYDSTFTFPTKVTNAKGHVSNFTYDIGTGNLISFKDPNNFTTSYEYDNFGRIVKEIRPYDDIVPTTSYTYYTDGIFPEGVKVSRRTTGSNTLDIYTFIDGLGRVVQTRSNAEDPAKQVVQDIFYNSIGKIQNQSIPYLNTYSTAYSTPLSVRFISLEYDPVGRITKQTNTDGTAKRISYDKWKETTTDENQHQKVYYKDAYNRISKVEEKNQGTTYATTYTYNSRDDLTKITDDKGNVFSFTYDELSRKTGMTDPDLGAWTYSYDGVGNLLTQRDGRGITTTFQYDPLNRVTKIDYPTDQDILFTYDSGTIGTLSSVQSQINANYYYDNRLRKTKEVVSADSRSWTKEFSYDSADRLLSQKNPGGETITYTYNNQGLLESIPNVINNLNYNAFGKITDKIYPNGKTTTLSYDQASFRLSRIYTAGIQDLNYGYDNKGNVLSINEAFENYQQSMGYDDLDRLTSAIEPNKFTLSLTYNSIGNIITVNENNNITSYSYGTKPHAVTSIAENSSVYSCVGSLPPSLGNWYISELTSCILSKVQLSYGSSLNITKNLTLDNSEVRTDKIILGSGGKLKLKNSKIILGGSRNSTAGNSLSYDANGNLISGFGFIYEYNDANQLKRVLKSGSVVEEYIYDHNGRRFRKIAGTETTYYVGKEFETKVNSSGTYNTAYYYGNGKLLARKDPGGQRYYYHNDHLGGTHVVTDSSGAVVERTRYYPYGKILEGGLSRNLFTGQEFDKETGIYYYGARYYNPNLMRFVQADPIIQNLYDPQQLNRYSYALNNPLKYTDPTGNYAQLAYSAFGYIASAVAEFGIYMSESWFAFSVFDTTNTAYNEAGLEGVAVNTAEWVVGSKVLSSVGGKAASTVARVGFARELSAAVKESSPGLYNSLKNAKTITAGSDFKSSLAKETALTEDVTVGRYFDEVVSPKTSNWLTTLKTEDSKVAYEMLNLEASGNQATKYATATIPKGTKAQIGFTKNGAVQIHIPDAEWLKIKDSIKWSETKNLL